MADTGAGVIVPTSVAPHGRGGGARGRGGRPAQAGRPPPAAKDKSDKPATPLVTLNAPATGNGAGASAPVVQAPEPITSIKQRAQSAPRERPAPTAPSSVPPAGTETPTNAWGAGALPVSVRRGIRGGRGGAAGPSNRGNRPDNLAVELPAPPAVPAHPPASPAPAARPATAAPAAAAPGTSLAARLLPHMAPRAASTSPAPQTQISVAGPGRSPALSPQWSPDDPSSPAGGGGNLRPPARGGAGGATSPGAANHFLLPPHAMKPSSHQPTPGSLTPRSADGGASVDGAGQAQRAKDQLQLEARLASITSDALRAENDCLRAELASVREQLSAKSGELLHVLRSGGFGADAAGNSAARLRTLEAELKDRDAMVASLQEQVMSLRMSSQVLSAEVNRLRTENDRLRQASGNAPPAAPAPPSLVVVASHDAVEVPHAALEELEELRRDLALERSLRETAQSEHQRCADLAHKYVVLRDQIIKAEESRQRLRRDNDRLRREVAELRGESDPHRGRSPRAPLRGASPGLGEGGRPQQGPQARQQGPPRPRGPPGYEGVRPQRAEAEGAPRQRGPAPAAAAAPAEPAAQPAKAPAPAPAAPAPKPEKTKAEREADAAVIAVFQSREMEKLPRNIKESLSSAFAGHARPYIFNFASLDELQKSLGQEGKAPPKAALVIGHAYNDSKIEPIDKKALENLRKAGVKNVALLVMRKTEDVSKVKDPPQSGVESGFGDKKFVLKLAYSGDKEMVFDAEDNRRAVKTLLEAADSVLFPGGGKGCN